MRWSTTLLLGLLPLASLSAAEPARQPNILILVADDLGYGELGCQGNPEIPTPHIDSLAKRGIRCTQGYVSAPYCCPSRAGLLTGRYQTRFGHERNVVGKANLDPKIGLPLPEQTIADALKQAGYATGLVGKWHLGGTAKYHPQRRGFDTFFGFLHEGHFYLPTPYRGAVTRLRENEPPYDSANPILRGNTPVEESAYLTDAFTREAVQFIDQHAEKAFFLMLAYSAVHSPMQATLRYLKPHAHITDLQRQVFAGMLSAMDASVGAILDRLRQHQLQRDTLIIFLSDNGGPPQELTSSNAPLRGGKGHLWEGGIRIPFLMTWPGTLPASQTYDQPVIALDLLPTILAAANLKPTGQKPLDGINLLPYLTGKESGPPHPLLCWRYGPNLAIRQGDWKLVRQGRKSNTPFALYNVASDLGETHNLAASQPERTKTLRQALARWEAEQAEPLWGKR